MSPSVNNFVHDLVEMARALEAEPAYKGQIATLVFDNNVLHETIQRLELTAIDRKNEMNELHSRIRSLEVERDDASFRVMEIEDSHAATLNSLRAMQTTLGTLIQVIDPPKPQPEAVPETKSIPEVVEWISERPADVFNSETQAEPKYVEGSFSNPLPETGPRQWTPETQPRDESGRYIPAHSGDPITKADEEYTVAWHGDPLNADSVSSGPIEYQKRTDDPSDIFYDGRREGQSEADPTPMPASDGQPELGPYAGKRYHDQPVWCNLASWLEGGGSEHDYYWRPAAVGFNN